MSDIRTWKITMRAGDHQWERIVVCDERDVDIYMNEEACRYAFKTGEPEVLESFVELAEPNAAVERPPTRWERLKRWWRGIWEEEVW